MTYSKLRKHWEGQYILSSNKLFPEFLSNLAMGGSQAQNFIDENTDLVETIAGGPEEVESIENAICKDKGAEENQVYFFKLAMRDLQKIKVLLQRKYEGCIRFCEQLGIVPTDYTAENLLPGVRQAEDTEEAEGALKDAIEKANASGVNKTELWKSVSELAGRAGWSRSQVWNYVDSITPEA